MKTLTHIPQQPDIPDQFIGCIDWDIPQSTKWFLHHDGGRFIFRSLEMDKVGLTFGLTGYHNRKDEAVNLCIKHGYTVLSFDSQAELDAWLKEGE